MRSFLVELVLVFALPGLVGPPPPLLLFLVHFCFVLLKFLLVGLYVEKAHWVPRWLRVCPIQAANPRLPGILVELLLRIAESSLFLEGVPLLGVASVSIGPPHDSFVVLGLLLFMLLFRLMVLLCLLRLLRSLLNLCREAHRMMRNFRVLPIN